MVSEATIGATIASIDSIRSKIEQECDKIEKEQSALEDSIGRLSGMWAGQAHDVFDKDFTQNLDKLKKITSQIRGMVKYEETAVNEYTKAETDANAAISVI